MNAARDETILRAIDSSWPRRLRDLPGESEDGTFAVLNQVLYRVTGGGKALERINSPCCDSAIREPVLFTGACLACHKGIDCSAEAIGGLL